MKTAILFLLLFVSGSYFGQHFYISGVVLAPDSVAVNNVLLETEVGPVTTDFQGRFHFELSQLPTAVTARVAGFPVNDFYIDAPVPGFDSVSVVLVLEPAVHDMEEVVVSKERVRWVYPQIDFHLLDYALLPSGFATCGVEEHKYYFRVIDDFGTVVAQMPVREHPQSLVYDCEGELHLVYYDSVYQLRWSPGRVEIYNVTTNGHFMNTISPCAAAFDSAQVLVYYSSGDWGAVFTRSESRLARQHLFYTATSRKYLVRVEEYRTYLARGGKSRKDRTDNDIIDIQKRTAVEHEKQQIMEHRGGRKILPVAVKVRDSLEIFDFMNDSVVVYDRNLNFIRRFPLGVHTNRHFHGAVFTDVSGSRVFFVLNYDGMGRILELNPSNGKVIGETKLTEHIYPFHIQVRDNFVYYLYQNHVNRAITFLYKQPLNPPRQ